MPTGTARKAISAAVVWAEPAGSLATPLHWTGYYKCYPKTNPIMSRDYAVVVKTEKGLRFKDGLEHNVNIWTVEYYGRIFKHLGLPTDPYGHTSPLDNIPALKHEYKGQDLQTVKYRAGVMGFRADLVEAVQKANTEMSHTESAEYIADEMLREFFAMFLDPDAVSVASDYCEEYHAG